MQIKGFRRIPIVAIRKKGEPGPAGIFMQFKYPTKVPGINNPEY